MNVSSLKTLGLPTPLAKPASAGKGATPEADKASFARAMTQVKSSKPTEKAVDKRNDRPIDFEPQENQFEDRTQTDSKPDSGDLQSENFEGAPRESALPNTGLPNFSGPGVSNPGVNSPLAKSPVTAVAKPMVATTSDDAVNPLTRRVVWNDFLRKMNDLGVSADDVLSAFATLSTEELAQPPEKSVDKVVMALGLNEQQSTMARQYFHDLVLKTKTKSIGDELKASGPQVSLAAMSQRDLQRKTLAKGLDNLERNFFMQAGPSAAPKAIEPALGNQADVARASMIQQARGDERNLELNNDLTTTPELVLPELAGPQVPTANPAQNPSALNQLLARMNEASPETAQEANPEDERAVENLVKSMNAQNAARAGRSMPLNAPLSAAASSAAQVGPDSVGGATFAARGLTNLPREMMPTLRSGVAEDSSDSSTANEDSGEGLQDAAYLNGNGRTDSKLNAGSLNKSEFQAQLNQAGVPQQPIPVSEAIQHAQMMVKDGGGEMKVSLRPDGLGEVSMRVSVENGKVNVQMVTETDEAKKLIERSIGDLKVGLAQNHLQVDSIKVDTATNLGKQLEQQYQDAHRQMAQQNLEQFRQDHQGWRRSFFEPPTVRQYRNQADSPRDVKGPTNSSNAKRAGARRLDLVA